MGFIGNSTGLLSILKLPRSLLNEVFSEHFSHGISQTKDKDTAAQILESYTQHCLRLEQDEIVLKNQLGTMETGSSERLVETGHCQNHSTFSSCPIGDVVLQSGHLLGKENRLWKSQLLVSSLFFHHTKLYNSLCWCQSLTQTYLFQDKQCKFSIKMKWEDKSGVVFKSMAFKRIWHPDVGSITWMVLPFDQILIILWETVYLQCLPWRAMRWSRTYGQQKGDCQ